MTVQKHSKVRREGKTAWGGPRKRRTKAVLIHKPIREVNEWQLFRPV